MGRGGEGSGVGEGMEERGRKRREEGREEVRRRKGRTLLNDQRLLEEEHGLLPVRRDRKSVV